MSAYNSLAIFREYLTNYGMSTYLILGNIGLIFNIVIFIQPNHRKNSCSLYILSMSLCGLIGLNISVIPAIVISNTISILNSFYLYCKLLMYFRHAFNQMMRSFFIFGCIDRYAISSDNLRIRSFSRYQIAYRIIPSVILFCLLLAIIPTVLINVLEDGRCATDTTVKNIILSIYFLFTLGIIPLGCMTAFSVLLYINLKSIRGRIQPIINVNLSTNHQLRKRDRDMIKMLLIEVIFFTITTIPTTVALTYGAITDESMKSKERLLLESFLNFVTITFLLFMNNCFSFWIYISTSRSFRLEFKSLILKFYKFITGKPNRLPEIN